MRLRILAIAAILAAGLFACGGPTDMEKTVSGLQERALEDELAWDLLTSLTTEIAAIQARLEASEQERDSLQGALR